jgi:hypothetical protein
LNSKFTKGLAPSTCAGYWLKRKSSKRNIKDIDQLKEDYAQEIDFLKADHTRDKDLLEYLSSKIPALESERRDLQKAHAEQCDRLKAQTEKRKLRLRLCANKLKTSLQQQISPRTLRSCPLLP